MDRVYKNSNILFKILPCILLTIFIIMIFCSNCFANNIENQENKTWNIPDDWFNYHFLVLAFKSEYGSNIYKIIVSTGIIKYNSGNYKAVTGKEVFGYWFETDGYILYNLSMSTSDTSVIQEKINNAELNKDSKATGVIGTREIYDFCSSEWVSNCSCNYDIIDISNDKTSVLVPANTEKRTTGNRPQYYLR